MRTAALALLLLAPLAAQQATLQNGQTPAQVVAILGPPQSQLTIRGDLVYMYSTAQVYFANGALANVATCPAPGPAPAPSQLVWRHGDAEYKDFLAMTAAADPALKTQLAAAFLRSYPDSDYLNQALQAEMGSQAGPQPAAAVQTALALVQSPGVDAGELTAAYTIIAFDDPNIIQPADPSLQPELDTLNLAITCGQQLLAVQPSAQAQYGAIFAKADGFALLTAQLYTPAIDALDYAIQLAPKDKILYYWRGIAEVSNTPPAFYPGIFDIAKSSSLPPKVPAIDTYLTQAYTRYHGSADGLQDVIAAAQANPTIPPDFKILPAQDVQVIARQALASPLPPANSFSGIKARLQVPELAAQEWLSVRGQGYQLQGIVTRVSPSGASVDLAVGAEDPGAPADLHLILAVPFPAGRLPLLGAKITVAGIASDYQTVPQFLLTLAEGTVHK